MSMGMHIAKRKTDSGEKAVQKQRTLIAKGWIWIEIGLFISMVCIYLKYFACEIVYFCHSPFHHMNSPRHILIVSSAKLRLGLYYFQQIWDFTWWLELSIPQPSLLRTGHSCDLLEPNFHTIAWRHFKYTLYLLYECFQNFNKLNSLWSIGWGGEQLQLLPTSVVCV